MTIDPVLLIKSLTPLVEPGERLKFHDEVVLSVEDGVENAVDVTLVLKSIVDVCEAIIKDISPLTMEEVEKYGKEGCKKWGATLTIKEAGVSYDYTMTNDTFYSHLKNMAEDAAKKAKEREEFLRKIPQEGVVFTDEDTGETYKIYPPAKKSKTIVQVSIPKVGGTS